MILADMLPYDPDAKVHRVIKPVVKPIVKKVEDSLDAVRDTIDATKDAVADSVAQSQLIIENGGTGHYEASLLWPIAVIAVALAACLYMAYLYRRRVANKAL